MEKFDTRVRTVRECLRERLTELKACERVRQETVKLRTFKAGDLVLFKTPGMNNKLCDAWQGPFRVRKRLGEVNYEIEKEDVGKKKL